MDDVNVLVIFYSRTGRTERLAVLLAEGAIQAGAKIRLRRARDIMPEPLIAADEVWRSQRERMEKEFAAPRAEDVAWADVIAFGTPAAPGGLSVELGALLEQGAIVSEAALAGKAATAFTSTYEAISGAELAISELQSRLLRLGFIVFPGPVQPGAVRGEDAANDYEFARVHGRRITVAGRAFRKT